MDEFQGETEISRKNEPKKITISVNSTDKSKHHLNIAK